MPLYRIAYVSCSEGQSIVRELAEAPAPGDLIPIDEKTCVTVVTVSPRSTSGTIAAEIVAELSDCPEKARRPKVAA